VVREQILARVKQIVTQAGFSILNTIDSSVKGRKGNQESFLWLKKA
jgi:predicted rRNA methylase YqxC with S4 and FtsJ domains